MNPRLVSSGSTMTLRRRITLRRRQTERASFEVIFARLAECVARRRLPRETRDHAWAVSKPFFSVA